MSEKNKVKINICGTDLIISTTEKEDYLLDLAKRLEEDIEKLTASDSFVSTTMAAMLIALNYLDETTKNKETSDNLREQLRAYMDESATARAQADEAKRQIAFLRAKYGE